jgi:4-hydroxybenzoate polyprenyltransferase
LWLTAAFAAGSVLMRGAGCVVNDIWDRDIDSRVSRTTLRPLASGALRLRHAVLLLVLLCLPALAILLSLTPLAQALGVGSLVLVALYPAAKRVTSWPQAVLGLTFGWGAPMGYAAASGRLDAAGVALYAVAILWILGYDTVYAHQDREDDTLLGLGSTARFWGENTRPFLAACYGGAILLLAAAGALAGLGWGFWIGLSLPALLLARQVIVLDIDNAPLCLALFRANREVGLAVALAIALGRLT